MEVSDLPSRKSHIKLTPWHVVACVVIGVAILAALLMQPPKPPHEPLVFKTLRNWLHLSYAQIRPETLSSSVRDIPVILYGITNYAIVDQARRAASLFLLAFSSGEYADYQRFRFPEPATLILSNCLALAAQLSDTNRPLMLLSPPPSWAIDSAYKASRPDRIATQKEAPPRLNTNGLTASNFTKRIVAYYSLGSLYKGYFEAIALKDSYIAIQEIRKPPEPLAALVRREENISLVISGTKYYSFRRTPDNILRTGNPLMIVTCKLMVRLRSPDTVVPQYIRYYLDPQEGALLPFQYVIANAMSATYVSAWF